jgi:hypothetical protein
MRKIAREGGDPLAERRKIRLVVPTFESAAITVHAEHAKTWRNQKHADQWINTLKEYVFPFFGDQPVNKIGTPEVLKTLSPIWLTKPETARRVRQRILIRERGSHSSTPIPSFNTIRQVIKKNIRSSDKLE